MDGGGGAVMEGKGRKKKRSGRICLPFATAATETLGVYVFGEVGRLGDRSVSASDMHLR